MTLRITPERAAEIAARCAASTQGPWQQGDDGANPHSVTAGIDGHGSFVYVTFPEHDRDQPFIAAARTDIPDLLADRAELLAEVERLRAVIAHRDLCDRAEIRAIEAAPDAVYDLAAMNNKED